MAQAERRSSANDAEAELGEPPAKKQKGSQEGNSSGRRQAACQACRLRKVKCDKKRPCCALCRASGIVCEYLGQDPEKITLETATHTILERLDSLRQELDSVKQGQLHQNPVFRPSPQTHDPLLPIANQQTSSFETSRDFLRIPAQRASADVILQWEIFGNKYPPNALIGQLFIPNNDDSGRSPNSPSTDMVTPSTGLLPLEEEQIPSLIDRFLTNVYTKNPILDVESLVKHGRKAADHGVGWDGWSCLVLMACALGSVAKPFSDRNRDAPARNGLSPATERGGRGAATSSARLFAKELQQGDSCFTLACRRLGSLKYSMLGAQCYFFAGVYLMYTLRPLQSWHYFFQASIFTQFYLRTTHGLSDSFSPTPLTSAPSSSSDRKARRIEQSLYWSCFKSECEYRVELPLPQSEISLGEYPQLFPSPPSPAPADEDGVGMTTEELELRQHASRLCNEEESWYYYLTEIALRRIGNRIVNSFFPSDSQSATSQQSLWINIRPLLRMAREFEAQVSSWSAHLPPAMQQYETSSIIRAPHLNFLGEGARSHVSRELSWAVDNRLLEMQTWLYQPFLYYLIHFGLPGRGAHAQATAVAAEGYTSSPSSLEGRQPINSILNPWSPATASSTHSVDFTSHPQLQPPPIVPSIPTTGSLDADDMTILESLITSGIDCSLKTLDVRPQGHRHHGLWFDLRSAMSAALSILAIIKSGNAAWIPGGVEAVWGPEEYGAGSLGSGGKRKIGGRIGRVLGQFEFWSGEAPDIVRYREILEEVVKDVRGS